MPTITPQAAAEAHGSDTTLSEPAVQERELIQFEQADEFRAILLGPEFFNGSLEPYEAARKDGTGAAVQLQAGRASASRDDEERVRSSVAEAKLRRMMYILDAYQEQSYLLDPYMEEIVGPPVRALQHCAINAYGRPQGAADLLQDDTGNGDVQRLAKLLYYYTKVRGFKTILHFFPHNVDDLLPTLALLEHCVADKALQSCWEMRYVLLLWMSLICMIPFDLAQFDTAAPAASASSSTLSVAARIEAVGRHFIASPGKERDAASSMLCKLFQRKDASSSQFAAFLRWSQLSLVPPSLPTTHLATGILQTLCNVVKVLTPETLAEHLSAVRSVLALYSSIDDDTPRLARTLVDNSLVNRYKSKMAGRLALKLLRPRKRSRTLKATRLSDPSKQDALPVDDAILDDDELAQEDDIPEEVEDHLGRLIVALQDKDTVVRYSAAKGIARVCCRLPTAFIDQVADEVTALFAVNVADLLGEREDLSSVSENTWQGCCFALAELARRGLLHSEGLGEKLVWVEKALRFDIRRGAHSVGVGVRDAACYVMWALARAHDEVSMRPYADKLSRTLVCVALLDRDVSIRRAASAAFQECVGRLNLFSHGIDVIRMTDFYAIGVRRNAFLQCLPQVAEFPEYRTALIDHLLDVTITHWDVSMRDTGARAIALVIGQDIEQLGKATVTRLSDQCAASKRDTSILHGSLLALAEIGAVCAEKGAEKDANAHACRVQCFDTLVHVPNKLAARLPGTHLVLRAACRLIATCVTEDGMRSGPAANVWQVFVDAAMERQEEECLEAAVEAVAAASRLMDLSPRIEATLSGWKRLTSVQGQGHIRVLGAYNYKSIAPSDGVLLKALQFLTALCEESSPSRSANVEIRRNACRSIADILAPLAPHWQTHVPTEMMSQVWRVLLAGLDDYSTDARGDVGSWIRLACMAALDRLACSAVTLGPATSAFLPQGTLDCVCAGLAKQMIEKIDSVRTEARRAFLRVVRVVDESADNVGVPERDKVMALFPIKEDDELSEPAALYAKVIGLLEVDVLRLDVLKGVILGVGSQRETINRVLTTCLIDYIIDSSTSYTPVDLLHDVVGLSVENIRSNRLFVPCIQAVNVVIEADVLEDGDTALKDVRRLLEMATRSLDKVKSVPRILAAAQLVTAVLCFPSMQCLALDRIRGLLVHPYPTVRAASAELLYVQLQNQLSVFPDEAEELLLSTTWATSGGDELASVVTTLVYLIISACK